MEWTRDLPTQPGIYGWRRAGSRLCAPMPPDVVSVNAAADGSLVLSFHGDIMKRDPAWLGGEWFGPVRMPWEPAVVPFDAIVDPACETS